jgi:hypothetical protein
VGQFSSLWLIFYCPNGEREDLRGFFGRERVGIGLSPKFSFLWALFSLWEPASPGTVCRMERRFLAREGNGGFVITNPWRGIRF